MSTTNLPNAQELVELRGLRTNNPADRIALRGVSLRCRISGMSYKTTLEQTFINGEDHPIEAIYTFPLPEGAAVCGFEIITGDRVLTGTVDETGAAIEKYDQAVGQGHGAYMVEQDRPDIFTLRVGNLKPHQMACVRLTFFGPLEIADRHIRLAFPTTIAPRYVSNAGAVDRLESQIDAEALNPPTTWNVPYGLRIDVQASLGRPVRSITSPTHAIAVKNCGEPAHGAVHVTFAGELAAMDRDVVLSFEMQHEQSPCLQVARGKDQAEYLAVTFVPEFDERELPEPPPSETVFVLDCSGSMAGESTAQAVMALELCLRCLSEKDTFNICRFGSGFEMFANKPVHYTQASLDRALAFIRREANLSGTELFSPLQAILTQPPQRGEVRQVILLTDGQVTNEPAVIDLARAHRGHNRIFSFGIGPACSHFLVKGIARATSGAAEFISGNERIEEKVLRTFGRMTSPKVRDIEIDWGGSDVQTLAEIPPVFDGEVLTVFGRAAGKLPKQVGLKCQTAIGPRQWSLKVPPISEDEGVISLMWARRAMQSLEEVNGVRRSSVSNRANLRTRDELIRLSKAFGLTSSITTFIAIEHRSVEERTAGQPEIQRVPVMLATGWGGITSNASSFARRRGFRASMCDSFIPAPAQGSGLLDLCRERHVELCDELITADRAAPAASPAPKIGRILARHSGSTASDLTKLLSLQCAAGWFDADEIIDQLLDKLGDRKPTSQAIDQVLRRFELNGLDRARAIRTLYVLVLLECVFRDQTALWQRAQKKAVKWLAKITATKADSISAVIRQLGTSR